MNRTDSLERYVKMTLIVEDDLSLRPLWENFFNLQLTDIGYEWAVSCEEALKMIQLRNKNKDPYFLILSDIFLAGSKTGIDLMTSGAVADSYAYKVLVSATERSEIITKFGHMISEVIVISKPLDFKQIEIIFKKILNINYKTPCKEFVSEAT